MITPEPLTTSATHSLKTLLREAATDGSQVVADPNHVRALLRAGADPNYQDRDGVSLLALAALSGHNAVVDVLLDAGADPDARDFRGRLGTPLRFAARAGHADVIDQLVYRGATVDPASPCGYFTPLNVAVRDGQEAAVERLLHHGADPLGGPMGATGHVYMAAKNGHPGIVRRLLAAGLSPDQRAYSGDSALHAVAQNPRFNDSGEENDIRRFLECGKTLLEARATVDPVAVYGYTPAAKAALYFNAPLLRMLLAYGASPDPVVDGCDGPLHCALSQSRHAHPRQGLMETLQLLLDAGADPYRPGAHGFTAVTHAERAGHLRVIEVMKSAGAHRILRTHTPPASGGFDSASPSL